MHKGRFLQDPIENSQQGLTLGVKAEAQKNIFNLPQVTNKC
jgi:hypothetical protein